MAEGEEMKSYKLVTPDSERNKIDITKLKEVLLSSKNGLEFEWKLKKMKLEFTTFVMPGSNVSTHIFDVLFKNGYITHPRGVVCIICRFNVYGGRKEAMLGEMRLHYTNEHNRWCRRL